MSKGKIVSLKRAWLATLTPDERAERKRDLRHWRDMTKTNEAFLAEHKAAMSAAVLQKIEDRIAEEVTASLRDPASTTLAEIVAITRARCENLLKNDEVRALAQ
jgi:hypothetical protein